VQAAHHHVAALLVLEAMLLDAVLRPFEGDDRRDLDRREGTVVVVALDARSAFTRSLFPTMKPMRHPAML